MARIKSKELTAAIRAPFWKRFGIKSTAANTANAIQLEDWAADNTSEQRWRNAADTDDIRAMSVNSSNRIEIGEEVYTPMRQTVPFNLATAASLISQAFWIAPAACRVTGITEIHTTAESTAATMTGYVEKLTGTTAIGSGSALMTGTFDLKGTAVTLQTATLLSTGTGDSDDPTLQLAAGDRLSFVFSTAGTELAGLAVEVTIASAGNYETVTYCLSANGDLVDQAFFVANRDYIVTRIDYVNKTKSSVGAATSYVQVTKDTSTNAPGAGTDILTNNTNSGFDVGLSNSTVVNGTLTATAATLRLAPGDRLAVDYNGTLTALAGVVITVSLQAVERRKEVTFFLSKNANQSVDQMFFTADRNYEVIAVSNVFSVTAGGASKLQVTRDSTTSAPGAGTDLLSNNTNAGFDLAATANTVQVGTFVDTRFNFLMAGDRLSVDYSAAAQNTAGVVVTVSLLPR